MLLILLNKKSIQELVFPEGIIIDTKKRALLTKKVNSVFKINSRLSMLSDGENKNSSVILTEESLSVETQTPKYNQFVKNVCLNDTKNDENEVRNDFESTLQKIPKYYELPDLEIPKQNENSNLWNEFNMDALAVMATFSYLVSIGKICPKTGKLFKE